MSTPMEYYNMLPPVAKTYAVICLMTSGAYELGLYNVRYIALFYGDVFKRFQIWRLLTNFFFIGPFSFTFAFRLLIILRYGVMLERGPFDKRTADYVWMFFFGAFSLLAMAVLPFFWSPFMGASLVFMIVYIWGREFPNDRINFHGLFELKGFYLPWSILVVDMVLGNPLMPNLLGIGAGHLYYFLTVLYPLAGGKNYAKTPLWVQKLVAYWGKGVQFNSPFRSNQTDGIVFQGRGRRLNETRRPSTSAQTPRGPENPETSHETRSSTAAGGAFSGRSYRLNQR